MKLHHYLGALVLALSLTNGAFAGMALDGKWTSDCVKGEQGYSKSIATFTGNTSDSMDMDFQDAACATQSMAIHVTGTWQEGPDSQIVHGAKEADFILSKIGLSFADAQMIGMINQMQLCGYSDWALNAEKDVTGKECNQQMLPKSGDKMYDIYKLETASKLLMGKMTKDLDGTSPEKRPHELDIERAMMKQ